MPSWLSGKFQYRAVVFLRSSRQRLVLSASLPCVDFLFVRRFRRFRRLRLVNIGGLREKNGGLREKFGGLRKTVSRLFYTVSGIEGLSVSFRGRATEGSAALRLLHEAQLAVEGLWIVTVKSITRRFIPRSGA
ncbi:MAG: hypothetical protein KBS75_05195 [Bacteroidales bacterium]|nr:hypothetical protein [Candidatus Equimonas faecalis]